jgi:hypothetical protein
MRPWELALCAALLLGLALWVVPAHSRSGLRGPWCTWLRGLPVLTVVLAAVQLTVEGPRWQLVPPTLAWDCG